MSPSPEALQLGAKAYQETRFYEKHTVRDMRQVPWILVVCFTVIIFLLIREDHVRRYDFMIFIIPVSVVVSLRQRQIAPVRYAGQKLLLRLLEEKYGDALPWVLEEKQLTAARAMEAEALQAPLATGPA